jgi:formylglycine-generating enzyme required for sulfatase activity
MIRVVKMADEKLDQEKHEVFISYANADETKSSDTGSDRQIANMICSALESEDVSCWLAPRDISPGDDWLNAILDAVEQSAVVVLVVSQETEKSKWVNTEIKLALEENKKIIPFQIGAVSPRGTLRVLKVSSHWITAHSPPGQEELNRLVKAVRSHLGKDKKKANEKVIKPAQEHGDVKTAETPSGKVYENDKGFREADYGDGIIMVYIPPGTFTMGSDDGYDNEKPPHDVDLDGFWIGKFEVTFDQYDKYCEETKKEKPGDQGWGRGKRPVINVSWDDAMAYSLWLSEKTGLPFKLPTEAQWEKAARGTDSRKYPWGEQEPDKKLANFDSDIGKTTPVGSYPRGISPYGLMDMAGNVWEWCSDWYGSDYYSKSPLNNPPGPKSGTDRVIRGVCWDLDAKYLRCAYRGDVRPSARSFFLGFRLCQEIKK